MNYIYGSCELETIVIKPVESGLVASRQFLLVLMEIHLIRVKKGREVQSFRVMKESGSVDP